MKKNLTLALCLLSLFMASCRKELQPLSSGLKASSAAGASGFKVVGYLPSWAGDATQVQYAKLTHIIYSFLIPTSTGGYQAIDNPSKLSSMVSLAHSAGTLAMISVGGGGGGGGFAGIVASSTYTTAFVNNMISFVNQYDLDGVDIDLEYPSDGTQAAQFLTMMQQLATALHNEGKILSIAVIGIDGDYVDSGMFTTVDFMTIMAYDDNNFQHSTWELGAQCLSYWLGRGLPASEAVLGVPFYGHDSSQNENSATDEVEYNTILADGGSASLDVFGTIGYNGLITMKSKTSYAMSNAGGVGIWELSGDATGTNSLLSAINSVVLAGGAINSGAPIGQTITLKGVNNAYVSSEDAQQPMQCVVTTAQGWEQFLVVDAGYGKVALENLSHYVSSEDGLNPITCNRTAYSTWEIFDWISTGTNSVTLRGTNDEFISSEDGEKAMTCNRPVAQSWETFGVNQ